MNMKRTLRSATGVSLTLALATAFAAGDPATSEPLTGKQKATAIGATSGAVAGAVVGGPVGAVIGAGIGGYVGHQGTDANGHVSTAPAADGTVRKAQAALNSQGYDVGKVDGRWGPNTENAVRRFQAKSGLTESGTLDSQTLTALGVNS
jgi:phage tail tape-measure protein